MNFVILDIVLLVLFLAFAIVFLYFKRKNLKQEGWLLLYKTKWGMKLIEKTGKKYKKTLKIAGYVSIVLGFILMLAMFILLVQTVYLYIAKPQIAETIKAPPLMPLVPYFPQIFGVQSFFPPFYFIYFIIAIIIVATCHEFSHGIFASHYGVKIKSTGFAFLKYFPAFFGAFVEQDDRQMNKKTKTEQMAVLSAGVFANIIITIIFAIILILFFKLAFAPSGVVYNGYSYSALNISAIDSINNIPLYNPDYNELVQKFSNKTIIQISANKIEYKGIRGFSEDMKLVELYDNSPALNANLSNTISSINGVKIDSREKLTEELNKYKPGQEIIITTIVKGDYNLDKKIILGENPLNKSRAWVGIVFLKRNSAGLTGKVIEFFSSYKKSEIYYMPKFQTAQFIYDLLWWIVLINLAVALFNMLPLGILDGGKFFYLGVLGITKSKKVAEKSFRYATYFFILLFLILMVKWVLSFLF